MSLTHTVPKRREYPTKPPKPAPLRQAPRGSSIAKKLEKHSSYTWSAITIHNRTIRVRPLSPHVPLPTRQVPHLPFAQLPPLVRLHTGKAVSLRGQPLPRAGSPAYWVHRLAESLSGLEKATDNNPYITPMRSGYNRNRTSSYHGL